MKYAIRMIGIIIISLTANIPFLCYLGVKWYWILLLIVFFLNMNLFPSVYSRTLPEKRLRICSDGCELLIMFLISSTLNILFAFGTVKWIWNINKSIWIFNCLMIILMEAIVFWNGIIRVYCTSAQIGLKWRVIGILCGWIPILNLIVLYKIIRIASVEPQFESGKLLTDELRAADEICRTRYPILMVHGVFFRDFQYFNYWGRIPKELEKNGANIFYGEHQSAASVADSAKELADRIMKIVEETGCEKLNIIAHSKGGLDCRYAIDVLEMENYVASLTTINTPHQGCLFADYLLGKIPEKVKKKVAKAYNLALSKLGDTNPDFIAAVTDLTAASCEEFNKNVKDVPGVYYQSIGSKLNNASGGRFPLNFSHHLVKYFDGANDGLVALESFPWGENYRLLTTKGKRGISHGDMIDLNRENIVDFDVREFYVELVKELKEKGF